jgi:hypothetical protein
MPRPVTAGYVEHSIRAGGWCNELYGLTHLGSLLGPDGLALICFYRAPDAEAVRNVSRQSSMPYDRVWSATLHGPGGSEPLTAQSLPQRTDDAPSETVLVSRAFAAPVVFEDLQAQEDAQAWCLQSHRVRFLQSLFSLDRRRMLCLYAAPDAEAVRHAQRGAGLPFEQIWTATICRG